MKEAMKSRKSDNTEIGLKVSLRQRYLPKKAKVLDCFCGEGEIYKRVYEGKVTKYLGLDHKKIHSEKLCIKTNNIAYISKNNINDFNVFDLDDYGCPWKVLYLILKKYAGSQATFFMTDGIRLELKVKHEATKWISATEQIPFGIRIPDIHRWYIEIFSTMLLDVQRRFNCKVENPVYIFTNRKEEVCYWHFIIKKSGGTG